MSREELEAQCAAMRVALENLLCRVSNDADAKRWWRDDQDAARKALSSNAGREYTERLRKAEEKAQTLEDAAVQLDAADCDVEFFRQKCGQLQERLRIAEEQLRGVKAGVLVVCSAEELERLRKAETTISLLAKEYVGDAEAPATDIVEFIETERERLRKAEEERDRYKLGLDCTNKSANELMKEVDQLREERNEIRNDLSKITNEAIQFRAELGQMKRRAIKAESGASNAIARLNKAMAELERCKKDAERWHYHRTDAARLFNIDPSEIDKTLDEAMEESING